MGGNLYQRNLRLTSRIITLNTEHQHHYGRKQTVNSRDRIVVYWKQCALRMLKDLIGERNCRNFCLVTGAHPTWPQGRVLQKLLLGPEIRSKLPGVEDFCPASKDTEFLDRDNERKQKEKDYAGNRRHAQQTHIRQGDKMLLQKPKSDKLSPAFEATPYEVVEKRGGHVEMKSTAGVLYKRNVTRLKKYEEDRSLLI